MPFQEKKDRMPMIRIAAWKLGEWRKSDSESAYTETLELFLQHRLQDA